MSDPNVRFTVVSDTDDVAQAFRRLAVTAAFPQAAEKIAEVLGASWVRIELGSGDEDGSVQLNESATVLLAQLLQRAGEQAATIERLRERVRRAEAPPY